MGRSGETFKFQAARMPLRITLPFICLLLSRSRVIIATAKTSVKLIEHVASRPVAHKMRTQIAQRRGRNVDRPFDADDALSIATA